jgi:hypothetical protein
MGEFEKELDAWEWVGKVAEKVTFIRLNAIEHRDISEEDYDLLKVLYKIWWNGEHPYYKACMSTTVENVIQGGLFTDRVADTTQGTKVVDYEAKNLNIDKQWENMD